MNIYIKSMVCVRCKMAVQSVLEKLHIPFTSIQLGVVELPSELTPEQLSELKTGLAYYELEIMDNKRAVLVERIKNIITEMVDSEDTDPPLKFTVYLSNALGYDYTYLSNVFSAAENGTIERFYISRRIEKVKHLMLYEEMSIKEVAYRLNYSSVSHLSLQFKKVTGITPSEYKLSLQSPNVYGKM